MGGVLAAVLIAFLCVGLVPFWSSRHESGEIPGLKEKAPSQVQASDEKSSGEVREPDGKLRPSGSEQAAPPEVSAPESNANGQAAAPESNGNKQAILPGSNGKPPADVKPVAALRPPKPLIGQLQDDSLESLLRRADAAYENRHVGDKLEESILLCRQATKAYPDSYEASWRLARSYNWRADQSFSDKVKAEYGGLAMKEAKRAMALNPDRVEGHYYYGRAIGEYAKGIGIARAVAKGLRGEIVSSGERAYEINKEYDEGGPCYLLGRYYYKVVWPYRDVDESIRYLEEARSVSPKKLRTRYYLAESYLKKGRKDDAKEELREVLFAKSSDPEAPWIRGQAEGVWQKLAN